jgi:hypothetical protein
VSWLILKKAKGEAVINIFLTLGSRKYGSEAGLIKGFQKGIIDRALEAEKQILKKKNASSVKVRDIKDSVENQQ